MPDIGSRHLAVGVQFVDGIAIDGIRDEFTRHQFLQGSASLFAFAVNNGPLRRSAQDVIVTANDVSPSALALSAHAREESLAFDVRFSCGPEDTAVIATMSARNTGDTDIFLRLVMPVIENSIVTPGPAFRRRIVVPQEIGNIIRPDGGASIGMPLDLDVGLPTAMNALEVACFYDAGNGGGVFFADLDGNVEAGIAPLQFVATENTATGFWIAFIHRGQTVVAPRLAIGVHHGGDWHEAVDYYARHHRPRWTFTDTPAWLRDQGAIYAQAGGGAGGILMALPMATLADGAIWTTWQNDDGPWRDGGGIKGANGVPVQVSTAALAPAGAPLAAVRRNTNQVEVFVVGFDGAVWITWEHDEGPWRDGISGRMPVRVSPPCLAPTGAPIIAGHQSEDQLNVFVVGNDGAIWVTWSVDGEPWRDGHAGRLPRRVTPAGLAPPGAHLAGARQNDAQLDIFVVGTDGAIWVTWCVNDGPWRDGLDGRAPARVTPAGFAPPGAPLAAAKQNDDQLDVFVVRDDGAIWVTYEVGDGPWTDGNDGRQPLRVSPPGFAPPRAHLAVAKQNDDQLDVFVVRDDGAIWVTYEVDDGPWTDAEAGRQPLRISTHNLAPAGAPLAAIFQNASQLDVLVVGHNGAISCTWEVDDGRWCDGADGRPGPAAVSTWGLAPPGAGVAVVRRPSGQLDAFTVGGGRLRSFRELPKLLDEARMLGTNVVYLFDYWEGTDAGGMSPYFNKGDYVLRSDLGGEAAFIDGVRALHDAGGRIIVYVEPFIVYHHSEIGRARGDAWTGRWPGGDPHDQYPDNWTMVAPFEPWQEYIVSVCERLVCHCGVDGIFLDSYGWQMNWPMGTEEDHRFYPPPAHARGVLQLADRVREAIRRRKPDAVVLGETAAGPIGRHMDGGLSAEFAWDWTKAASRERIRASPIRYAAPEIAFYSNGRDLAELRQVYAAGHNLALCSCWPGSFMYDHRDYIRRLVEIRQTYKDALIHGAQEYQPEPQDDPVVAYLYRGMRDTILTIVNIGREPRTTSLLLRQTETDAIWEDLLDPGVTLATLGTTLPAVALEGGGLRVLRTAARL